MLRSLQLHSMGGNTGTCELDVFLGVEAQLVLELRLLARVLFLYTYSPSKLVFVAALVGVMVSFVGEAEPLFCATRTFP